MNPDNSPAYVAYGKGANCDNQIRIPCSLNAKSTNLGCTFSCGSAQALNTTSSYYLQKHSSLIWVPATSSMLLKIPNTLKLYGRQMFMFGRALINGKNVLGKIQAINGLYLFETYTNELVQYTSSFEVLTCFVPCGE